MKKCSLSACPSACRPIVITWNSSRATFVRVARENRLLARTVTGICHPLTFSESNETNIYIYIEIIYRIIRIEGKGLFFFFDEISNLKIDRSRKREIKE